MIEKKEWSEFRCTGLVLFINQILHVFGWSICFVVEGDQVKEVYPARVKFRGFPEEDVSKSYSEISTYLKNNISILDQESKQ